MKAIGKISQEQSARLESIVNDPKNKARLSRQRLDKDAFFKLLMEQLKYQDPMAPMDNSAMLQQMSQFTTMEQLGNMVKMQENMTKATEGVNTQLKALIEKLGSGAENTQILAELRKMNRLLESYVAKQDKKQDAAAILNPNPEGAQG